MIKFTSDIDKVIKDLDKADKSKRAKAAVFAQRRLRAATPQKTGKLRRSIKIRHWQRSTGVGFTRPDGSHAHLVEYGHDIIRRGRKIGRVVARPFFAPMWEEIKPELTKIMSEAML